MSFYVDFLGLSRDTNPKHVNLGQQQFHLAATDDPPQRITGSIGLTVPSLQKIKERAERAKSEIVCALAAGILPWFGGEFNIWVALSLLLAFWIIAGEIRWCATHCQGWAKAQAGIH